MLQFTLNPSLIYTKCNFSSITSVVFVCNAVLGKKAAAGMEHVETLYVHKR